MDGLCDISLDWWWVIFVVCVVEWEVVIVDVIIEIYDCIVGKIW